MKKSILDRLVNIIVTLVAILSVSCVVSMITLAFRGFNSDIFKSESKENQTDNSSNPARLSRTVDYGENYLENIVFIGDYTVSGMGMALENSRLQIWSGENGSLSLDHGIDKATVVYPQNNESLTVSAALALNKPTYLIITLGLDNGVPYCSELKFKEYYSKLIEAVLDAAPDTKIMLQSIFPVSDEKQKDSPNISNEKIDAANKWIEELAENYSLRYLNTSSALKDNHGNLSEKYNSGDGITPSSSGYSEILFYIRTHGYK